MRLGIIGGTAMTSLATDEIEVTRSDNIIAQTDFGPVPMICVTSGSTELIFIERHHGDGTTPPHRINHRANIRGYPRRVVQLSDLCHKAQGGWP